MDLALGPCLKSFFDGVTATPIPERIQQLAKALEDALERGDLCPQNKMNSRPSRV